MKVIWIFIRGICGDPADCQEWEQKAVDWVLQDRYSRERGFAARAVTYSCSPLTVWIHEEDRVKSFAEMLKGYVEDGWKIHVVMHSNGTRIGRDALKRLNWPRVESVHLVCGACDSDMNRTGFNDALKRNRIGTFFYYIGGRDWAMKIENTFLGKLDFALPEKSCPMGWKGPRFTAKAVENRVIEGSIGWEDYGHSTCFDSDHFNQTMVEITRAKERTEQKRFTKQYERKN